jgi:hypothetical protein
MFSQLFCRACRANDASYLVALLIRPFCNWHLQVLPFWKKFRTFQIYRRALPGMNASSVGLILASVFKMTVDVYSISPFPTASLCIGLFAFTAVDQLQVCVVCVPAGLGWSCTEAHRSMAGVQNVCNVLLTHECYTARRMGDAVSGGVVHTFIP